MKFRFALASAVLLLVASLAHAQSCSSWTQPGPIIGIDAPLDPNFEDTSCGAWQYTGNGYRSAAPWGGYAGRIDSDQSTSSKIYQDFSFYGVSGAFTIGFYFDKSNVSGGPEVLKVQIRRVSDDAVLETVTTLSPSDTSGNYTFSTANYNNQNVRLVFLVAGGRNYGTTTFWVDAVHYWANYQ